MFGAGPGVRVQPVELALVVGELPAGGFLDRHDEHVLAFVAQVGQGGQVIAGLLAERGQHLFVFAQAGGVVFAAGTYLGGPDRPPVGGGRDLDVAAMVVVFA
ncbi:hypothetical protein GCM10009679_72740 [Saccharothrix algeriensis]|uniref:Uncharacterized protein n=1 Tax=Catellatospora bangladeshensis TaxID=310355 RepID=A0A8J3JSU1_9ACTN|nr:hypothetical protein Cba03nite_56520 [Catellatospora bangladeshensis]